MCVPVTLVSCPGWTPPFTKWLLGVGTSEPPCIILHFLSNIFFRHIELLLKPPTLAVCCCWRSSCCHDFLVDWIYWSLPPLHWFSSDCSGKVLGRKNYGSRWLLVGQGTRCEKRTLLWWVLVGWEVRYDALSENIKKETITQGTCKVIWIIVIQMILLSHINQMKFPNSQSC